MTVQASWQMTDLDDGGMLSLPEDTSPDCWSCGKVVSRRQPYAVLRLNGRPWLVHSECKVPTMGRLDEAVTAPELHLERVEGVSVTGWGRWHVLDAGGELVGIVVEDHEWTGADYGPAAYDVAHNPTGGEWEALWRSEGHSTPQEALGALVAHLAAEAGSRRPKSPETKEG